ncbi:MAG: type II toxin-antitoxin system HicA family toxin [Proteobacteria bacterium]|jgi:predicted RNA binding protein YcfA (HicA-like mRNA interferase family)|nr:type II toxin-antitoxin system HicA family toxin [Pseudomonadota bacterium]
MKYREAAGGLRRLGCEELPRRSGGSHRKWHNPRTGKATVVPDWGAKDLKSGTLRGIVQQLGIEWNDFENA